MNIHCREGREKRNDILKYNDCVQDNSLFGNEKLILNHKCLHESIPQLLIKEDSILRKLRHKDGCKEENGSAFYCSVCKKEWTSSDAALMFALYKYSLFPIFLQFCQLKNINPYQIENLNIMKKFEKHLNSRSNRRKNNQSM